MKAGDRSMAILEEMIGEKRREFDRSNREMFPSFLRDEKTIANCRVCNGQDQYSGRHDWIYCDACDGNGIH